MVGLQNTGFWSGNVAADALGRRHNQRIVTFVWAIEADVELPKAFPEDSIAAVASDSNVGVITCIPRRRVEDTMQVLAEDAAETTAQIRLELLADPIGERHSGQVKSHGSRHSQESSAQYQHVGMLTYAVQHLIVCFRR